MSKFVTLHGFGQSSSGIELNFEVVGGTTQPSNPTENMIWVNTNEEITGWIFSYEEPDTPENNETPVWIEIGLSSPTGFNALVENNISIYPSSIKQYISGSWVLKEGMIYQQGWKNFGVLPSFKYTGNYEIVDDYDNIINSTSGGWKIRFLTSGTLTFSSLNSAADGIDVFVVGGGGGGGKGNESFHASGGAGGYTKTQLGVSVTTETVYNISVGAGGAATATGGTSSAFGVTAAGGGGGTCTYNCRGGTGGSGGGTFYGNHNGGSDGSNGGGTGQGTTTREFGEAGATLYAGGGAGQNGVGGYGGGGDCNQAGANNFGGGGGASTYHVAGKAGGSGIVIIRNARG